MSEMVERVARGMHADLRKQRPDGYVGDWDESDQYITVDCEVDFRALARAAIAAMREPTEEMQKARVAPDDAELPVKVLGEYLDYWTAEAVWHAMIDAALKDGADAEYCK